MDKMIYVNDVYIPFLKEERMTQIYYGGSSIVLNNLKISSLSTFVI